MLRQLNIIAISFLAFALGINYCLLPWLNYEIIGLKGDFMSSARLIWGTILAILGFLLLVLTYFIRHNQVFHKYWTVILSVVFVMQLPMASLWYMMLMREPLNALLGVGIHTLLIGLITVDYLTPNKTQYKPKQTALLQDQKNDIKLDT